MLQRGGPARHDRADPRRDGCRQGAPRADPPLRGAAAREAVRRRQLRRDSRGAVRVRALRVPAGRVHRGDRAAAGPLPAGERRAPSFSTRSARCRSALQSKLLRAIEEKKITPHRRGAPDRHRRPVHRDHQPGSPGGGGARRVPARPVLPARGVPAPRPAAPRAGRGHPAARGALSRRERAALQEDHPGLRAGGARGAGPLSVARQRAGAREFRGARGHHRARGRDRRRRAVPGPGRGRSAPSST